MRKRLWTKLWTILLLVLAVALLGAAGTARAQTPPATFEAESHRLLIDRDALYLAVGEAGDASLLAALTPGLPGEAEVVFHWSSADPEIAMVSDAGASATVTALRGGATRLIAEASIPAWEVEWRAECVVWVHEPVRSINLSTGLLALRAGDPDRATGTLAFAVQPPTHTEVIAWRVEHDGEEGDVIAFDAQSGAVQALREGTAYVVAEASGGVSARCKVLVEAAGAADLEPLSSDGEESDPAPPAQGVRFTGRDTAVGIRLGGNPVVLQGSLAFEGAAPPEDQLTWRTSDRRIARVDEQGAVYPVRVGKATVTVRTPDGDEASSMVTVYKREALSVRLHTQSPARLNAGKTFKPSITFVPAHSYAELRWSSSDAAVAAVEPGSGLITGLRKGTAVITAQALDGSIAPLSLTVTVSAPITSLAMYADTERDDAGWQALPGQSRALAVVPQPAWDVTSDTVTWVSSNARVASVDRRTGEVTAHRAGVAVITARASSGARASCHVRVINPVQGLALPEPAIVLEAGQTRALKPAVSPKNHTEALSWASADPSVATVSPAGVVTGVSGGKTEIVVTTAGGLSARCVVTVEEWMEWPSEKAASERATNEQETIGRAR
ncbi:MAG: Ig-like domain-containing protein [Clostridia bacterium]|nr:Ig-like domain-containing protein [Clostridia bacterium]